MRHNFYGSNNIFTIIRITMEFQSTQFPWRRAEWKNNSKLIGALLVKPLSFGFQVIGPNLNGLLRRQFSLHSSTKKIKANVNCFNIVRCSILVLFNFPCYGVVRGLVGWWVDFKNHEFRR